jgi:hypothetical protein
MTNPRGNVTTYTYDNRRRLTGIQGGSSCDITNTYADDRLVKIRHNMGHGMVPCPEKV